MLRFWGMKFCERMQVFWGGGHTFGDRPSMICEQMQSFFREHNIFAREHSNIEILFFSHLLFLPSLCPFSGSVLSTN